MRYHAKIGLSTSKGVGTSREYSSKLGRLKAAPLLGVHDPYKNTPPAHRLPCRV